MGDFLSVPSSTNPSLTHNTTKMSSSETPQTLESQPQTETAHQPKTLESVPESSDPPPMNDDKRALEDQEEEVKLDGEEEEEEEGECGFCLFMKGGNCKDSFIAWEKCIEESEKNKEDISEKCFEVTAVLKKCMEAHPDYYGPILQAEKVAEEEAVRELDKQKEKEKEAPALGSKDSEKDSDWIGEKNKDSAVVCMESFVAWEKCIEEGEKNKEEILEKCFEVTVALKKCMDEHPDWIGPFGK